MTELTDLSVVVPVWGDYVRYLPGLLVYLAEEGVEPENLHVVANGESLDPLSISLGSVNILETAERLSIGAARNAGLAVVTTELVCFCDADDLPVRGALARLYLEARRQPQALMFSGLAVRESGESYGFPPAHASRPYGRRWRLLRQWNRNHLSLTTGTLIRTAALRAAGGFPDYNLAEDGMLGCMLVWFGPVVVLPEPTRIYRVHPDGLCQRGHDRVRWRQAFRFQRRYLRQHPSLPLLLRLLTYLYVLPHRRASRWLEQRARYDF